MGMLDSGALPLALHAQTSMIMPTFRPSAAPDVKPGLETGPGSWGGFRLPQAD